MVNLARYSSWIADLGAPQNSFGSFKREMVMWGYPSTGILRVTKDLKSDKYTVELIPKKGSMLYMANYKEELEERELNAWFEKNKKIIIKVIDGA